MTCPARPLHSSQVLTGLIDYERPRRRDLVIFLEPPMVEEDSGVGDREAHINSGCRGVCECVLTHTSIYNCCQGREVLLQSLKLGVQWCVCLLSKWGCRLVEAGLALCGPQHCRVINDLMAGEVSSFLQLSSLCRYLQCREVIHFNHQNNCCITDLNKFSFF